MEIHEAEQNLRHLNGHKRAKLEAVGRELGLKNLSLYNVPELREAVRDKLKGVVNA